MGRLQQALIMLSGVRADKGLDVLGLTDANGTVIVRAKSSSTPVGREENLSSDEMIRPALENKLVKATQLLPRERLERELYNFEEEYYKRVYMKPVPTEKAKSVPSSPVTTAMALMVTCPGRDRDGGVLGVLYGGRLLNRNHELVDRIKATIFEDEEYKGKDIGTVTVFQWNVGIATNVKKPNGERAIGTLVSAEVYDKVLENGEPWYGNAFVVNDYYMSAYEPIKNIRGEVIGIMYVGVLEAKYSDMRNKAIITFLIITAMGLFVVFVVSLYVASRLTGPLKNLTTAAKRLAEGQLDYPIHQIKERDELGELTYAFRKMAQALEKRERELKESNAQLVQLNNNYMEMMGFVTHELKTPLASSILNAHSLKSGYFGELNEQQRNAAESIARSLHYFEGMVKNYLDLSRIEKGELRLEKRDINLNSDVVKPIIEELRTQFIHKKITLDNRIGDITVNADPNLMKIVFDNLISNAIKYGFEKGRIELGAKAEGDTLTLNVWNAGEGIPQKDFPRLFKKFSRLNGGASTADKKGAGLGLFITREIIEKHGGTIRVESEPGKWCNFIFTLPLQTE